MSRRRLSLTSTQSDFFTFFLHPHRPRKLVICGDTVDASGGLSSPDMGLVALAHGADVLVHEATNAYIDPSISANGGKKNETLAEVTEKAAARGHSTPQGAGSFAGRIGASQLLLNHFSVRYPSPPIWMMQNRFQGGHCSPAQLQIYQRQLAVMQSFEEQATTAWHAAMPASDPADAVWRGKKAIATYDGFVYSLPRKLPGLRRAEQAKLPPAPTTVSTGVVQTHAAPNARTRNSKKYWNR